MNSNSQKTPQPRFSITVDAIPEDEERQDELNRIMRKPGEGPYDPNAKWMDPPKVKPSGTQETLASEVQLG